MTKVIVTSGDITKVRVEAIVTLINPNGLWFGGIDRAITGVAGSQYHSQIGTPLRDGQVIVASGNRAWHKGDFNDVVFVVDDLLSPLSDLVFLALQASKKEEYVSVAMPLFRTGVMLGKVEPDVETVAEQMVIGIEAFLAENTPPPSDIYLVIYNNPQAEEMLRAWPWGGKK